MRLLAGGAVELRPETPKARVAPGQILALYDADDAECLGGGPLLPDDDAGFFADGA